MKRKIWLMLSMVLLFSLVLTGCEKKFEPTPLDPPELTAEQELQIKEDYAIYMNRKIPDATFDADNFYIYCYAGKYNGFYAILIGPNGAITVHKPGSVSVAGRTITLPTHTALFMYKDSEFIDMEMAYEQLEIISRKNVRDIKWFIDHMYNS